MAYQIKVFAMRYFNSENKIQWANREKLAQEILQQCQRLQTNFEEAVLIADGIARKLEYNNWLGDIVVREWQDDYEYLPTKYSILVTIEKSPNQMYYLETYTPSKEPWKRSLNLNIHEAYAEMDKFINSNKRRNYCAWIYPQNAPLGKQAILAITNEVKTKKGI